MDIKDALHKTIDNAADALSEAGHRINASTEQAKRDAAGDEMSTGDKAKSVLNEGKEKILAEVDKTKQDVRNKT
jgi:F0F1-type ATP synthase membrane subunit b/b'